jgi:hypothetical protein
MNLLNFIPFVLAVLGVSARGDILGPGQRRVEHLVEFTNLSTFTNYHFLVYPRDLPRGHIGNSTVGVKDGVVVLSALNPLAVGRNRGAYLFAVPKDLYARTGYPREEWFTNTFPGILRSPRLVDPIRALPISDPRQKIITRYRVEGLPDKLDLIRVESLAPSPGEGEPLKKSKASALVGLSCAGAAWIVITQFRRRSARVAWLSHKDPRS